MTAWRSGIRPATTRSHGQSLVEFALVFPLFLLLLLACFDLGRAVFAYNSITNAAREGARLGIVNQDTSLITQRVIGQTVIAEVAAPNVTVSFKKAIPNADYAANASCSPLSIGCLAVVRFETTYRPITPIVSNIVFGSGVTLVAESYEAIEFVCPNTTTAAGDCPKQP